MSRENGYGLDELMVVEASRHVSDWDVVLVGTGMPVVASLLALKNHAPNMCFVVETGPMAPEVIPTPSSIADSRVMYRSVRNGSLIDSLGGVLQRGLADIGFIGGAQIDQFANVNSTVIGDYAAPKVRFPGSGGANDIASHAKKVMIIARHELRRFPGPLRLHHEPRLHRRPRRPQERRADVALPGHRRVHRPRGHGHRQVRGPAENRQADAGVTIDRVRENTGFEPIVSGTPVEVEPPSARELRILREQVDPTGVYVKAAE